MSSTTAQGELIFELVQGKTTPTHVFATYPLKFLHPFRAIATGKDTSLTYILGYGGGLVGGDCVNIKCELSSQTTVVLCTQATTKVFKSDGEAPVSQTYQFHIASQATLAFVPDPVTCFSHSLYYQNQEFQLAQDSNVVFVDWITSGRKRNFITKGGLEDARIETNERWDFDLYDTSTKFYINGELVLADRVRLADEEQVSLRQRMHKAHVVGLVVVIGNRFNQISEHLLELSMRKKLPDAKHITPQGRLADPLDFPGILASASALTIHGDYQTKGVILRFCSTDTECAMTYMKDILSPLYDILGYTPYQDNR